MKQIHTLLILLLTSLLLGAHYLSGLWRWPIHAFSSGLLLQSLPLLCQSIVIYFYFKYKVPIISSIATLVVFGLLFFTGDYQFVILISVYLSVIHLFIWSITSLTQFIYRKLTQIYLRFFKKDYN